MHWSGVLEAGRMTRLMTERCKNSYDSARFRPCRSKILPRRTAFCCPCVNHWSPTVSIQRSKVENRISFLHVCSLPLCDLLEVSDAILDLPPGMSGGIAAHFRCFRSNTRHNSYSNPGRRHQDRTPYRPAINFWHISRTHWQLHL